MDKSLENAWLDIFAKTAGGLCVRGIESSLSPSEVAKTAAEIADLGVFELLDRKQNADGFEKTMIDAYAAKEKQNPEGAKVEFNILIRESMTGNKQ